MELNYTSVISTSVFTEDKRVEDIADTVILYYKLYMETWSDSAYRGFIRALNAFLEEISPTRYVQGLACKIDDQVYMSIWDARVDPQLLRRILLNIYRVYKNRDGVDELRRDLRYIISAIGDEKLIEEILEEMCEPECLISLATLILVIGTNA
jgi:hypothetical protein